MTVLVCLGASDRMCLGIGCRSGVTLFAAWPGSKSDEALSRDTLAGKESSGDSMPLTGRLTPIAWDVQSPKDACDYRCGVTVSSWVGAQTRLGTSLLQITIRL